MNQVGVNGSEIQILLIAFTTLMMLLPKGTVLLEGRKAKPRGQEMLRKPKGSACSQRRTSCFARGLLTCQPLQEPEFSARQRLSFPGSWTQPRKLLGLRVSRADSLLKVERFVTQHSSLHHVRLENQNSSLEQSQQGFNSWIQENWWDQGPFYIWGPINSLDLLSFNYLCSIPYNLSFHSFKHSCIYWSSSQEYSVISTLAIPSLWLALSANFPSASSFPGEFLFFFFFTEFILPQRFGLVLNLWESLGAHSENLVLKCCFLLFPVENSDPYFVLLT